MNRYLHIPLAIALGTLYGLVVRGIFDIEAADEYFRLMSLGFMFGMPVVMGFLTVLASPRDLGSKWSYASLVPWLSVVGLLVLTLFMGLEGWICWIMALPLFLAATTVGGLLGCVLHRKRDGGKIYFSVAAIIPFLISPVEQYIGATPDEYEARTYIDIQAPADVIWDHVTRVHEIPESQDKGWLNRMMGFPRPLSAELDTLAVGGKREAIFTNGLVFHEQVVEYTHQRKMRFSIDANPYEIPSTTMDEHVVVGGEFFDVIDGVYELEQLDATTHRLHLYSHFSLRTSFNFYASVWARWIMLDIQDNILQVQKARAEGAGN